MNNLLPMPWSDLQDWGKRWDNMNRWNTECPYCGKIYTKHNNLTMSWLVNRRSKFWKNGNPGMRRRWAAFPNMDPGRSFSFIICTECRGELMIVPETGTAWSGRIFLDEYRLNQIIFKGVPLQKVLPPRSGCHPHQPSGCADR